MDPIPEDRLYTLRCDNCGYVAWSLFKTIKCPKCKKVVNCKKE